jgi:hypothetical protein
MVLSAARRFWRYRTPISAAHVSCQSQMKKSPGRVDHGFVDINAMALNAAISGSILAEPEACFVMMMALPFGSTLALATAQDNSP